MIKLDKVTYNYHNLKMYFNFELYLGEKIVILGPNGSGKSTLLNLIAGFLPVHTGNLWLNGTLHNKTIPSHRPISILFQDNNLFTHITVSKNISLGLNPNKYLNLEQQKQMKTIVKQVGLEKLMNRFPITLSPGESQLVALARCLLRQQPILLLDEPFSSLDPSLRVKMLKLLNINCKKRKLTLLMVSHNIDDALKIASRTILIVDGNIYYDGSILALINKTTPESNIINIY